MILSFLFCGHKTNACKGGYPRKEKKDDLISSDFLYAGSINPMQRRIYMGEDSRDNADCLEDARCLHFAPFSQPRNGRTWHMTTFFGYTIDRNLKLDV